MKLKKLSFALILTLLIALIAGCSSAATPTESSADGGTLILSVNPSIAVEFDNNGNVENLSARNDDAKAILESYTDFQGKPTKEVVLNLVERIGNAGFFVEEVEGEGRNITIEIEKGSKITNQNFIKEITSEIRSFLSSSNLKNKIVAPREDVTDFDVTNYDTTTYGDSDFDQPTQPAQPTTNDSNYDYEDSNYTEPVVIPVDDTDYDGVDTDYNDPNTDYDGVDTDFDDTDYDGVDTDYADTDYDGVDSDYVQPAPVQPQPQPVPQPPVDDSDYDVSDYSDYDDSDYGD